MKTIIYFAALIFAGNFAKAQTTVYQNSYIKPSTGTYVEGHYKTKSNNTNLDNYSTTGNVNSYTGQTGSRPKDYSVESSNYSSNKTVYTGSQGGQYYINSNGNKTYVPKK